jgi:DNA-directed RNA polymerase specialized sigma24 family protein
MVRKPEKWKWSSYRASTGLVAAQPLLSVDGLLAQFAKRRPIAQARYARFVAEGIKAPSPWQDLKGQVFLGDEQFVNNMQALADKRQRSDAQIPKVHRRPAAPTLAHIAKRAPDRNSAMIQAHATGAYSYQQIAEHFGVHFTTVGKVVRRGK